MSKPEEARRIVTEGLELRRISRQEAQQEARLEQYEQDMISGCNQNCVNARRDRLTMEQDSARKEKAAARRAARAAAKAKAWQLECKANDAVRFYGIVCLVVLLVSAVTKLPFWAAATLMISGAIFPAAYIYRLYNPIGGDGNAKRENAK